MCGRFAASTPPARLAQLFDAVGTEEAEALGPSWNVAPSQPARLVCLADGGGRILVVAKWGFVPAWAKDPSRGPRPINARSEMLARSKMFRAAWARRRCLVPVEAFYEWERLASGRRQPWAIARRDAEPFGLGGIWEERSTPQGELERSFAVVTTRANQELFRIHDRMPVVVDTAGIDAWLDPSTPDEELSQLLEPAPPGLLVAWRVSTRVNSPRHDGPDLLGEVLSSFAGEG